MKMISRWKAQIEATHGAQDGKKKVLDVERWAVIETGTFKTVISSFPLSLEGARRRFSGKIWREFTFTPQ